MHGQALAPSRVVVDPPAPPPPRRPPWRALALLVAVGIVAASLHRARTWHDALLSDMAVAIDAATTFRPLDTVFVYDRHGEPLDRFHLEQRVRVDLTTLPAHVSRAFLAAEDRRFDEHDGVDWQSIARAAWVNGQAGRIVQGGSTIAQQLVKHLVVGQERSYDRKIREAVAARALTTRLGRHRVLELYLNFVYLGHGRHGVEAAAQAYYGVPAASLSPAQAATLATLVPAPELRNPLVDPQGAQRRRDALLAEMVKLGWLSAEQARAGAEEPIANPHARAQAALGDAYRTEVRRQVAGLLGSELPHRLGLRVHTPYDPDIQALIERAIDEGTRAASLASGLNVLGPNLDAEAREAFLTRPSPPLEGCHEALAIGGNRLRLGAEELRLSARELMRPVRPRPTWSVHDPPPRPLAAVLRTGDLLRVCLHEGSVVLDDRPWVQGAAVVIDHHTGEVVAISGGRDVPLEGFVRATQARRQAGSTFKTYVYAASLTLGYTPDSVMVDQPLVVDLDGRDWTPANFGHAYAGPVTLTQALARSLNSVAVQLTLRLGPDRVAAQARMMGVTSPVPEVPAIALGAVDLTPLDQAVGYAVIAADGQRIGPVWLRELRDADGRLLGRAGGPLFVDGQPHGTLPGAPRPVLAPETAEQLRTMLREVVEHGSGRRVHHPDEPRHGKTGTSDDAVDAWFVGSTPRHTIAVWLGADDRTSLGRDTTGGTVAGPVWKAIADGLMTAPSP